VERGGPVEAREFDHDRRAGRRIYSRAADWRWLGRVRAAPDLPELLGAVRRAGYAVRRDLVSPRPHCRVAIAALALQDAVDTTGVSQNLRDLVHCGDHRVRS